MSTDRAGDNPPEQEAAAPGGEAGGEAGREAGGAPAPRSDSAASLASLAAAVRAVESGERSAASFFAETPRAAKAPAARPARDGAAGAAPAPAPQQAPQPASAGPAREEAAQRPAGPPPAPARPSGPEPGAQGATAGPTVPAARPALVPAPGIEGVRRVLAAGGAPEALAERAAEALGQQAAEALTEDPWQLLTVPGVRPEQADGFARALLGPACEPGDERRAQALIGWLLEQAAVAGHSALEASALRAALAQRAVPEPDEALQSAIADGAVLVFQDALDTPGRPRAATDDDEEQPVRVLLGLDRLAMAEESVADGLARLLNTFEPPADERSRIAPGTAPDDTGADDTAPAADDTEAAAPESDTTDAADDTDASGPRVRPSAGAWAAVATAAPSGCAAELIQTVAFSGLVTHTGGEAARAEPAALIAAARALGLRAYGAAHTADGRRRLVAHLAEVAPDAAPGEPAGPAAAEAAVTVSGLLSGAEGPGRDADGALALDLLVVLDAPQLDLETTALLVESLTDGTRLVLSGDPGVLWSAGPGRLFQDVLQSRFCPQAASRTPDFGPIGELVSGISVGELTEVDAPGKEVVTVPVRDAAEAVHRTVQLVADSVPRALGIPAEQTQVITVGHGGAAGTRALNAALKERLNAGPGRFGGFDPGDRAAYSPALGRTLLGTVTGADADGLHLDCAGTAVVVPREQVDSGAVRHGWALTAHQAAGSRWPAAVVVLPGDAAGGLTRAWVHTAFGRAERHLSVVQGVGQALSRAVAELPAKERTTRLRTLLRLQAEEQSADPAAG
ncbi:helix-hairpin-helix domain-containing protein [Streptomyces yunnanensis]|uniref:ATP-dependent exoDNAse (Exonuclease V), alpha subunit, helicase superfamily I n=1 Tax=Streptomyces yunnanensis TaxID=156453 RepID=A0A9X8QTX5_9ACTN|nr:helix-hairpin-helix domain-containing protein [Streptomyces yunnanensis]SHM07048.1 ATP-dependent exoDNAse (exonuclease V), alpha subunit, helicase superfamily I [Streptomyces yunnanensis]